MPVSNAGIAQLLLLSPQKHPEKYGILVARSTWATQSSLIHSIGRGVLRYWGPRFGLATSDFKAECSNKCTKLDALTGNGDKKREETTVSQD